MPPGAHDRYRAGVNAAAATRALHAACANPYGACANNADGRMVMFTILAIVTGLLAGLLIIGTLKAVFKALMPVQYQAWQARMAEQKRLAAIARAAQVKIREPLPPGLRMQVWNKSKGRCQHCGRTDAQAMAATGEHLQNDHIRPFSRGGAGTLENLQLLCGPCNRRKSNHYVG
jgi:hypothetical protein